MALLARDRDGAPELASAVVAGACPALTPGCRQAHWLERACPAFTPGRLQADWLERAVAESCAVVPEGHAWLQPLRFSAARGPLAAARPGVTALLRVARGETHEVAVGLVHAGIIEPGHFRFQPHGDGVPHLKITLGYQHRGVARALVAGPDARTVHLVEG